MWHAGTITGETNFCPVGGTGWLKLKVIAKQLEGESQAPVKAGRKSVSRRAAVWGLVALVVSASAFAAYRLANNRKPVADASAPALPLKLPSNFDPRLTDFLREATTLSTLTGVGVTNAKYRDQFVTTASAFEMLSTIWPKDYASEGRQEFTKAMEGWRLLLDFWQRKLVREQELQDLVRSLQEMYSRSPFGQFDSGNLRISPQFQYEYDANCIQALERYAPERITVVSGRAMKIIIESYERTIQAISAPDMKRAAAFVRFDNTILALMGAASEHFNSGRKLIESSPLGK